MPAIVRWPGVVPPGGVTEQAAITMDWTATILAATGTAADPARPMDGVDLLPVCTGARPAFDRELFWRISGFDSGRVGRWKYLKTAGAEYLFDLHVDPGEKTDLRSKHPAEFEDVRRKYQDWNHRMLPLPKT